MFPFLADRNLIVTTMVLSEPQIVVVSLFMVTQCEGAFVSLLAWCPIWAGVWMGPCPGWGQRQSQATSGMGAVSAVGRSEARHCSLSADLTSHFAFLSLLNGVKMLMLFGTFSGWRSSSKLGLTQWNRNLDVCVLFYLSFPCPLLSGCERYLSTQNPWLLLYL